jgi:GTP-binding protein
MGRKDTQYPASSIRQPVSSQMMNIISAKYIKSSPGYKDCPPPAGPEYAFIGRSNVGKSSLINMITHQTHLAKTSGTPGKTQLINHFEILSEKQNKRTKWSIVDLPGYGYAKVSIKARHNWDNMIGSYIRKRENLVCLFVLIDSRHEPQAPDLEFINKLGEWQKPFVIVLTKTDKNKPAVTIRNLDLLKQSLSLQWETLPPIFLSSAIKKEGRTEILGYIQDLNASFTKL